MRRLVIDTTTTWLSVALFEGDVLIGSHHYEVGRGHAEQLLPAIAALPDGGRAAEIWVGCGPGSFTGLRIGIAAARALGFAWSASVRGFDSLALIAADAGMRLGLPQVGIVTEGGHGEWLVAEGPLQGGSLPPTEAAQALSSSHLVGSKAQECAALRGWGDAHSAFADTRAALHLDAAAFIEQPSPIYARAPDAAAPQRKS